MNLSTLLHDSTRRLTILRSRKELSANQCKAIISVVVILQLTILGVFCMHVLMIPAEAAKHLNFAMIVLQKKMPYKDVVDMVSPMMLYLDIIPAYLANLTRIHPIFIYNIFVWTISCICQYLCLSLVFKSQTREKYFLSIIVITNSLLQLFFLQEFGQIDHLFLLFTVPYWLCRMMRWNDQKPSDSLCMIAGVSAGIGFSLSFLYPIFLILIELCFWLDKRKTNSFTGAEFTCCCAIIVLYLGHLIVLPDAMGSGYMGWILPLTFMDYWQWDDRLSYIEKTPDRRDLIYIFLLVSTVAIGSSRKSKLIIPALTFAVLGFGLYIVQGQMFTYQALPMMWGTGFALSLVVGIFFILFPSLSKLIDLKIVAPIMLLCSAVFLYFQYLPVSKSERLDLSAQNYFGSAPKCDLSNFSEFFLTHCKPGDKVLILNDRVRPAYPLILQLGLKPAGVALDYSISHIFEQYNTVDSENAIQKYIFYENNLWEPLPSMLVSHPPKIVMYDEEAMNPLLDKHLLKKRIEDTYPGVIHVDWNENIDKHPKFEYLSFRYPIAAHTRKY